MAVIWGPFGQPSDAASSDAQHGKIVVANVSGKSGAGSVSVCTLAHGCTTNLRNSNIYEVDAVALANSGDCWASARDIAGSALLIYFRGCTGSGRTATHFQKVYPGGLDIDKNGNLISISEFDKRLYVYHGCNPSCRLVGGPFALQGTPFYGHVNKPSTLFAVGDPEHEQVDMYSYAPSSITYKYSFDEGLGPSNDVEGVAFNPR